MALGSSHDDDGREIETFDLLVIGAGVSGINAAYRLQTQCPDISFAILEGRGDIGGTWDLFRYPGIRSDSDLFTYGFAWEPWPYETPIAEGCLILDYMKNCIAKYNLGRYMRFHHRVLSADWSRERGQWTLTVEHNGALKKIRANWVHMGTGYYDYEKPLKVVIPGLENFRGTTIHPQFWPQDYDHVGKNMVIIGSGATAMTLFPTLSRTAKNITMVQRSPTWVYTLSNGSPGKSWLKKFISNSVVGSLFRMKYIWFQYIMVLVSQYLPSVMAAYIGLTVKVQLPKRIPFDPHFKPHYQPWQQRLCVAPDGELFNILRENPNTHIVTGHIDTITETGLVMKDGTVVEADAIVTATGLSMHLGGRIVITVDGEKIEWAGRVLWNGSMVQDVPNLMLSIGYIDNAWTLGADETMTVLTRLLNHMRSNGISTATPRVPPEGAGKLQTMWPLISTYSMDAQKRLPIYGSVGPWRPRMCPPLDWIRSQWTNITTGLQFSP